MDFWFLVVDPWMGWFVSDGMTVTNLINDLVKIAEKKTVQHTYSYNGL